MWYSSKLIQYLQNTSQQNKTWRRIKKKVTTLFFKAKFKIKLMFDNISTVKYLFKHSIKEGYDFTEKNDENCGSCLLPGCFCRMHSQRP